MVLVTGPSSALRQATFFHIKMNKSHCHDVVRVSLHFFNILPLQRRRSGALTTTLCCSGGDSIILRVIQKYMNLIFWHEKKFLCLHSHIEFLTLNIYLNLICISYLIDCKVQFKREQSYFHSFF